jgi:sulfoxide reductase heme-binding subunit YedZ
MKDPRFGKFVVFINSLVPLTLLLWDAYYHHLGANPVEFAIRTTGMLTLVFLILSLCVTPVRKITGWNWLSHFRRMLGVYAFFYGVLHFSTYFWLDRELSVSGIVADTVKRPFILFGMTGLLLMVPLAITSTNGMIKRMGGKNWKRLHKLVYPAAIAGVLHYYLLVKADVRQPVAFAVVLGALLLYRMVGDRFSFLRNKKRPVEQAV